MSLKRGAKDIDRLHTVKSDFDEGIEMSVKPFFGLGTFAALAVFLSSAPVADTITVCEESCDFSTIQEAVDHSGRYAQILIEIDGAVTEANIEIINKGPLTISGLGPTATIVQAAPEPCADSGRVFLIERSIVTLENMTIQNGCVNEASVEGATGGGIWSSSNLLLQNVILRNNVASVSEGSQENPAQLVAAGGGLYSIGNVKMSGTLIVSNTASSLSSTGAAHGGGIWTYGIAQILRSSISGNSVIGDSRNAHNTGGGIFNDGQLEIELSTIAHNNAPVPGGGIATNNGSLIVRRSVIRQNMAGMREDTGVDSGCIDLSGSGHVIGERVFITGDACGLRSVRSSFRTRNEIVLQ